MILYAIKHLPTGNLMPQLSGRGYTHWVPQDGPALVPRLFHTFAAANVARGWWLKGRVTQDNEPDYYGEVDGSNYFHPDPSRKAEDIVVVSLRVEEVS